MPDTLAPQETVSMELGEDHAEIRASVRAICASFPSSYWR
jgi:hypothetical protein